MSLHRLSPTLALLMLTAAGVGPAQPLSCTTHEVLQGPTPWVGHPPQLAPAAPEPCDRPLPINLATALRLADNRPLVIAAAEASLRVALARLGEAEVLWLPDVYVGGSYYRHDGGAQGNSGTLFINGRDQILLGGGLAATVSVADALFAPLAARQVLRARENDVQTARNDALLAVAEAYFNVQQARGRLAGAQDTVAKAQQLAAFVDQLSKDLVPPTAEDRVQAELAEREDAEARAREAWRVVSADLTRELRLCPTAVVLALEPPYLQLTLISPGEPVDDLIPLGLRNRPELAAQQALVEATLVRIRQEKLRPLIPSVVLMGDATPVAPGGYLMGGLFASDTNQRADPLTARNDVSLQLLWELRNLGLGNQAAVRVRQAENQQAVIDLFRIQDRVAAEIAQAHAQLASAAVRVGRMERAVKAAQTTYAGSLKGLSETTRVGNRPQEVVAAVQLLARAYDNYFLSVNDYNRAQFRLYHALGYPAGILACEHPSGPILPLDPAAPPPVPAHVH
jgi:outer membrane protein TolC